MSRSVRCASRSWRPASDEPHNQPCHPPTITGTPGTWPAGEPRIQATIMLDPRETRRRPVPELLAEHPSHAGRRRLMTHRVQEEKATQSVLLTNCRVRREPSRLRHEPGPLQEMTSKHAARRSTSRSISAGIAALQAAFSVSAVSRTPLEATIERGNSTSALMRPTSGRRTPRSHRRRTRRAAPTQPCRRGRMYHARCTPPPRARAR